VILGFGNNVQGAIAANITASQTVIPVFPGTGALFATTLTYPSFISSGVSGSVPIYSKLTLTDQLETVFEVCHLLSVSGDNLTVIRGQESTTAKGWSLNDTIANFSTRGSEHRFVQVEEVQRGFFLSSPATGTANALVISLPSTLGENSATAATANFRAPVLIVPSSTNTGSTTITASVGLLNFPTNAPLLKAHGVQLIAGDIQAGIPFQVIWSETAQAWYHASVPDLSSYATIAQVQSGVNSFAQDTGTANAYVCAFIPALTARNESAPLRFKVKTTNTGACTLNDGIGTVPLVGGAHAALQGGELLANGDAWVQWNATVGAGSYILLFCTGAPEQVAPATQTQQVVNAGQIQTQALTAFTTAGTAPAFTLTPTPAITAYAANQRFQVTFSAAGGATPTLNVSGLGAQNLKQYTATGSKIAAIIASGQTSDVVYDGTDMVVLDQLPNSVGVTPAQFDNSTKLATTAFAQGVGLHYSSLVLASANITLTAATHAGAVIVGNSSSAINVTLPSVSTMPAGSAIKFWNYATGTMNLLAAGSDSIYLPGAVTSYPVPTGSSITLGSSAAGVWFAIDGVQQVGVQGSAKNLVGGATGLSKVATYTADEIIVESASNAYQVLRAISIAPSLASSGANGLDSGSASAATLYNEFVIWGGGAPAGLFSLSATAPTMPAGYTHKARVGTVRTDSSGNILSFNQIGNWVQPKPAAGSNVTFYPTLASGVTSGYTAGSATWTPTAVSVSGVVPPTATEIGLWIYVVNQQSVVVAPNTSFAGDSSTTNPPPIIFRNASSTINNRRENMILESSNIYWGSDSATTKLCVIGWRDSI